MANVEESNQEPTIIQDEINKSNHLKDFLRLVILGLVGVMFLSLTSVWIGYESNTDIQKIMTGNLQKNNQMELVALRTILICNSLLAFFIPAMIFNRVSDKSFLSAFGIEKGFNPFKGWSWSAAFFAMALPLVLLSAWFNQQIPLPEWASKTEENVSGMLIALMGDNSVSSLMLNVFIMAFLPALGEEWFFRGSMQRILMKWFNNSMKAILICSFLFSALHFQLEGLLPRFLLGSILGFIFYKTGNIWISVFLHFLFNGFQIVAAFFSQEQLENLNSEKMDAPGWIQVLVCSIVLYFLYKQAPVCLINQTNEQI